MLLWTFLDVVFGVHKPLFLPSFLIPTTVIVSPLMFQLLPFPPLIHFALRTILNKMCGLIA